MHPLPISNLSPAAAAPRPVAAHFFQPLLERLPHCPAARACPALSDEDWLRLLLGRVLHEAPSGRGFLQQYGPHFPACPAVPAFFESLKSGRRLELARQLNTQLQPLLARHHPDRLGAEPALRDFDIYAGDGHWHGAAAHDPRVEERKYATGHFFGLNLRTHGLVHLTGADQEERRKEHDMRALKRLPVETLRQGAPVGRKVLWVWDKAGIDFRQWFRWKQSAGIYFLSCAKENMKLEVVGTRPFDRADAVNAGVVADELVATSCGVTLRRVTYVDPASGERFEFLTNEMTLAPGWIAYLYRRRWDVEKIFDQFKNKLGEKKAWASRATAKAIQAQMLCLAHNLIQLLEDRVLTPAGVTNRAEDQRRHKRLEQQQARAGARGERLPRLVETLLRATQWSVKLVRWLRYHLFLPTCWETALRALRALYAKL